MTPLVYDSSAWELAEIFGPARVWTFNQLRAELDRRLAEEKKCRWLHVDYYRIGQVLSFELPLTAQPRAFPTAWPEFNRYPWQTWPAWRLQARWEILHAGWRRGDVEAGRLFQNELAALRQWESFTEPSMGVNLVTGHLAACLSLGLADATGWDSELYRQARQAAQTLLTRDIRPWAAEHWGGHASFTAGHLHNIPFISLIRSAQLAAVIRHPDAARLNRWAQKAIRAWMKLRAEAHYTEGFTYDGYLIEHVTAWMESLGAHLKMNFYLAGRSLCDQWIHCVAPGRFDLQAPIGDVEPEMPFWMTALMRMASWWGLNEAFWLLHRCPPRRLPASMLVAALDDPAKWPACEGVPETGTMDLISAVSLRNGWKREDVLGVVGCPRWEGGHLHADGGQVILARAGRFWITDPGYQQYRPGPEREYTLGSAAHNGPVIDGHCQTRKAARLLQLTNKRGGRWMAEVDLSACYETLPRGASVRRTVCLERNGDMTVEDRFDGLSPSTAVVWHWHGGAQLAWAFADGQARLDDGERVLWITTSAGAIQAGQVTRLEGSRGPLTLTDRRTSPGLSWRCRWDFRWRGPAASS